MTKAREAVVVMPRDAMRDALAAIFDVSRETIDAVRLVERSRFARLHGRRVAATTRRGTIYLAGSQRRFVADPECVLHAYFHVLRQWDTGALTHWRYLREALRHGPRRNRYEVAARTFTRLHVLDFAARLRSGAVVAPVIEPEDRDVRVIAATGGDAAA